ncbi:MAG TPA: hypothetical protein VFY14_10945 [Streptomyces sp.]|nr:hypothetical protein [Streptomyces sp.]
MSARKDLYAALMQGGPHSPDRSEKASAMLDAFRGEEQALLRAELEAARREIPSLWILEYPGYDGEEPTLHLSPEAARAAADKHAEADPHGRSFDWIPEDGVERQIWTHELDDSPTDYTGAQVWRIAVQPDTTTTAGDQTTEDAAGVEPDNVPDPLARVAELERYRLAYQSARSRAREERAKTAFAQEGREIWRKGAYELQARVAELTVYRAEHDSIVMGLYTTAEAARAHCEAKVRQEEPADSIRHLSWSADDIGDHAEYELHITPAGTGGLIRGTGYVVTALTVQAAYDEEADE